MLLLIVLIVYLMLLIVYLMLLGSSHAVGKQPFILLNIDKSWKKMDVKLMMTIQNLSNNGT